MKAKITNRSSGSFTLELEISYSGKMLESEEALQNDLNEAGALATEELLTRFDTDGSPIVLGGIKFTSKGKEPKKYQSPFGEITVDRHVYQSSKGGKTYCPLEELARIIITATPKFAKLVSSKYANAGASVVVRDLRENHGRDLARSYVKKIGDAVGSIAIAKEERWAYSMPDFDKPVRSVAVGLDGTCMLLCDDGWREAMVGTLAYYDKSGNRMHTTYTAATPEYGKERFLTKLENEIARAKDRYGHATFIGIADGAKGNWDFLSKHTEIQTVDFWHATGYLGKAAAAMFRGKKCDEDREEWLEDACHRLKHKKGVATRLLNEMITFKKSHRLPKAAKEGLNAAITYFTNHRHQMKYSDNTSLNRPIGSGVTEAACKTLVSLRLCQSGMKWVEKGAGIVLSLRSLVLTDGRWKQFWNKIDQYGLPLVA